QAPAAAQAPPSNDLRSALWRLQTAAAGDDYTEFKSALAAARAAAAAFPPGGERNAANDAVAVYADVERLWDYANNSATGAFFDASTDNGALLSMLNRYPGFGHALADATMEIGGRTIYPTSEARHFLAAEGAKKLTWMGAATPAPVPVPAPVVAPPPASVTTTTAAPKPVSAPVTATPAAAPSAPTTTTTAARSAPTSTTPPEKPEAVGGRINLLLALILIVVGLGVLISLFRASA